MASARAKHNMTAQPVPLEPAASERNARVNTFYSDERVGQSVWADDAEVLIVRRSYPSGSAGVAITFAYSRAEWGAAPSMTVELNPKDAHWLAAMLLRAAEDQAGDAPEPIGPLGRDDTPF